MKSFAWQRPGVLFDLERLAPNDFRLDIEDSCEYVQLRLSTEELACLIDGMLDVLCSAREQKLDPAVTVPDRGQPHCGSCSCANCVSRSW